MVDVRIRSPSLQGERRAETNREGFFAFRWLPVGTYTIQLQRLGYEALLLDSIVVRLGRTATVGQVRLVEAPIEVEALAATAKRLLIDPESTAGGMNLTPNLYKNLPISRDYRAVALLAPQVDEYLGTDLSVAGGTGPETKFYIEGADVTDPVTGVESTRLPYNFVREVEVKTGGYEAEYRSTLGGIINVVTHQGGNQFESQVYGFYTSDRFEGSPRHGLSEFTKQSSSQYDVGVTLGGPIQRDRLWYFAAYNPSFLTEGIEIPEHGLYDDRTVRHVFASRLTWRAARRTSLFLTAFGDPGNRDVVQPMSISTAHFAPENPDTWLGREEFGGVNVVVGATQLLGAKGILDVSASTMSRSDSYLPITEPGFEPQFHDYTTETVSGGTTKYGSGSLDRSAVILKSSWALSGHTLKAGGEYMTNGATTEGGVHHVIKKMGPSRYREVEIYTSGEVRSRVGGLFVQDSWQASDRWRLNAGARWDTQALLDSDGAVAQVIPFEIQPRLGFIFQPGRLGTQRLYGSFGRYYQDLALNAAAYFNGEEFYRWTGYDHDPRVDPAGGEVLSEFSADILEGTEGLKGQFYDAFTLGYERQLGANLKLGARGVFRKLRRAVEDAFVDEYDDYRLGNPGEGILEAFPEATRTYGALELTAERTVGSGLMLACSYRLSSTRGNYQGLFNTDYWTPSPNASVDFDHPDLMEHTEGRLPQDRTHSLKLATSYMTGRGLAGGLRFVWQTGTPVSIRGGSTQPPAYAFLAERGSMGRTPNVWDLDLRFVYDMRRLVRRRSATRLVLDVFNVGSPRTPLAYDDICCFTRTEEGYQTDVNENYGEPARYQPPMTIRLGFEVDF
jgi:hypothetical protein